MSIYAKAMALFDAAYPHAANNWIYDIDYDVHTRHCCKIHGCKYGEDEFCTVVVTPRRGMTGDCQSCFDDSRGYDDY